MLSNTLAGRGEGDIRHHLVLDMYVLVRYKMIHFGSDQADGNQSIYRQAVKALEINSLRHRE
jgi:hypothetical protein